MATNTRTLTFDSTSDVNFRAWGSGISAALVACGLALTTDTGQINWTTVTRSSGTGEIISGYEVFKFTDSLQTTKPVFIKIEYGHLVASSTYSGPVLYVTVGTATDGAGTLNGSIVSTRTRLAGGTSPAQSGGTATTSPIYASGDTSAICLALGVTTTAQPLYTPNNTTYSSLPAFLLVERSRDTAGNVNSNGVVFLTSKWTTNSNTAPTSPVSTCQMLSFTGSAAGAQDAGWPIAFPGLGYGTAAAGSNLYLFPIAVATPKVEAQALGFLGAYKGDVAFGTTISLTVSGSSHTYLSLTGIAGTANNDAIRGYVNPAGVVTTTGMLLMRYE